MGISILSDYQDVNCTMEHNDRSNFLLKSKSKIKHSFSVVGKTKTNGDQGKRRYREINK